MGWSLEMLQRWLIWDSKMSWGSIFTPKFVTVDDREILEPEKVMMMMWVELQLWHRHRALCHSSGMKIY